MTGTLKQKATVKTNDTPGSVCRINVEPVKFAALWAGYPSSPPYGRWPTTTFPTWRPAQQFFSGK